MGELGELLRKARQDKGLSLAQVEEATRIRGAYLQALEEEAYDRLPAPVYVKGLLKNYALYLGLDAEQALGLYQAPQAPAVNTSAPLMLDEPLHPLQLQLRQLWPLWLAVLVTILLAAGWWGYPRYRDRLNLRWPFARPAATAAPTLTPSPTATITVPAPTATLPPATFTPAPTQTPRPTLTSTQIPTPTTVATLELTVEVVGERAWLLVQADDQAVFAGILEPGATNTWTARERIVLRCGNSGAVQISLNGQSLGQLGDVGQVIEREWTVPGVPTRTPAPSKTP